MKATAPIVLSCLFMFSAANAEQNASFQPLIHQLSTAGIDSEALHGPLAKALGFNSDKVQSKFIEFPEAQSGDQQGHGCDLVVSSTTSGNIEYPSFVFTTHEQHGAKGKNYFFRVNLNGELQKSITVYGENDKSGKPIKGSGHLETLDIKSRNVRKRLQHELDFWLKGMYRKK